MVHGQPSAPGVQKAPGLTHCEPPLVALNVWRTREGSANFTPTQDAACPGVVAETAEVERLATMERFSPPTCQPCVSIAGAVLGAGDGIGPIADEVIPRVKITVPVIQPQTVAVEGNDAAVLGHIIQGMRPGIGELPRQTVPRPQFENGLQGIVVGVAVAVELQDQPAFGYRALKGPPLD